MNERQDSRADLASLIGKMTDEQFAAFIATISAHYCLEEVSA